MTAGAAASLDALWFVPVEQRLESAALQDAGAAVRAALAGSDRLGTGARVALAVGSRGIDRLAEVVRETVGALRERGAEPFIVPAMGSHGGATAEGQREVLAGYGVAEAAVGAAVASSMETVLLGAGPRAHFDRLAAGADAVVVINRVKPHSILTGDLGSGLCKMTAVGLGKHAGAKALHDAGLEAALLPVAEALLAVAPVAWGLALVEDAFDRLSLVEGVAPAAFPEADRRLLRRVRAALPTLPFDPLDGVVFVWAGKDISGAGMDPNVVGMHRRNGGPPQRTIGRLGALRLTAASHGNAVGVGMADSVPQSFADAVDWAATRANAETSGWMEGARLRAVLPTEEAVVARVCAGAAESVRAVIAEDTAHLDRLLVTPGLLPAVEQDARLRVAGAPLRLRFDAQGRLLTPVR